MWPEYIVGGLRIVRFDCTGMGYRHRAGRSDPDGPFTPYVSGILTGWQEGVRRLQIFDRAGLGYCYRAG